MIKNPELLKKFEEDFMQDKGRLSYNKSLQIFMALWNEGVKLGVLPLKNPLEGIEVDIKVAKILNSCLKKSSQG
ncbi:MAG: hypothetical protein HY096_07265 [Nitrospinae bacterium]|nr:hypothetical protein [Nitrospinota bacterium]